MGEVIEAVLSAIFLFVATLGIGLIPVLYMNKLTDRGNDGVKYLKYLSDFGIGMLLGTSCLLVIPEGVEAFGASKSRSFGISLLLGFLILYGLDLLVTNLHNGSASSGMLGAVGSTPVLENYIDLMNPKKSIPLILSNNVVFALVIHGFSDGLALGIAESYEALKLVMLIAICIHKIPATLSLTGLMISKQRLPKLTVISNLIAFSLSTPVGLLFVVVVRFINKDVLEKVSDGLLVISGSSLLYASLLAMMSTDKEREKNDSASYQLDDLATEEPQPIPGEHPQDESPPSFGLLLLGILIPLLISLLAPEED